MEFQIVLSALGRSQSKHKFRMSPLTDEEMQSLCKVKNRLQGLIIRSGTKALHGQKCCSQYDEGRCPLGDKVASLYLKMFSSYFPLRSWICWYHSDTAECSWDTNRTECNPEMKSGEVKAPIVLGYHSCRISPHIRSFKRINSVFLDTIASMFVALPVFGSFGGRGVDQFQRAKTSPTVFDFFRVSPFIRTMRRSFLFNHNTDRPIDFEVSEK